MVECRLVEDGFDLKAAEDFIEHRNICLLLILEIFISLTNLFSIKLNQFFIIDQSVLSYFVLYWFLNSVIVVKVHFLFLNINIFSTWAFLFQQSKFNIIVISNLSFFLFEYVFGENNFIVFVLRLLLLFVFWRGLRLNDFLLFYFFDFILNSIFFLIQYFIISLLFLLLFLGSSGT